MTVRNLVNTRGNKVVNQFVIEDENKISFQSYRSLICEISKNYKDVTVINIFPNWNYSTTTARHFYEFLRQNGFSNLASRKDIEDAIKTGRVKDNEKILVNYEKVQIYA